MNRIVFLTLDEILAIHMEQIRRYGGETGTRDFSLLESAIAQPQSGFSGKYFHEDHAAMAAAYMYHIVQDHPFVDGNKRTGAAAAYMFLGLNDLHLTCTEDELVACTLQTA